MSNLGGTNLGGGIQGISTKQMTNSMRSSDQVVARKILRSAWNTRYATGTVAGRGRVIGEFRAVNNLGDFLGRQNYSCGGSNQINHHIPGMRAGSIPQQCDGTGIPASTCNPRFVPDSSDYITYKKQRAMNHNYNDSKAGGDQSNASFVDLMRVRRR